MDLVIFAALGNREENVNNKKKEKEQTTYMDCTTIVCTARVCYCGSAKKGKNIGTKE